MKKLVSLLLAVITVFSMLQVTAFAETRGPAFDDTGLDVFPDVPGTHWAYPAVRWAVDSGVTAGMGDGTFGVDYTVTRAQAVTFLWAYNGKPKPTTQTNPFRDVKKKDWFYSAVLWAVENGITVGTSSNTFSPDNTCSIAQIATMMYAMAGKPDVSGGSNPYTNVTSSDYYSDALKWCKMKNLLQSIPGEYFPKGGNFRDRSCTRAVIVTLLYNHNNSVKVDMEKMVQLAVSKEGHNHADRYRGVNYGEYYFGADWCASFVSWCAQKVGLAGSSNTATAAMPVTGDCGDMLNHFLKKRTAYISSHCFNDSNWNTKMKNYGYATENGIEMSQSFVPKRGDIVVFIWNGECASHVGFVTSVQQLSGGKMKITTIEGNTEADEYDENNPKEYWERSHVAVEEYVYNRATGEITKGCFDYIVGFCRIR